LFPWVVKRDTFFLLSQTGGNQSFFSQADEFMADDKKTNRIGYICDFGSKNT
jgi:hypothetical protein